MERTNRTEPTDGCDDAEAFVAQRRMDGMACDLVRDEGNGLVTR